MEQKNIEITFIDVDPLDSTKYCELWFHVWFLQTAIKYGAPAFISIINVVIATSFKTLSPLELYYTQNDETMMTFIKLSILQFINVGIVMLVQSLKFDIPILNEFYLFNGTYPDFT